MLLDMSDILKRQSIIYYAGVASPLGVPPPQFTCGDACRVQDSYVCMSFFFQATWLEPEARIGLKKVGLGVQRTHPLVTLANQYSLLSYGFSSRPIRTGGGSGWPGGEAEEAAEGVSAEGLCRGWVRRDHAVEWVGAEGPWRRGVSADLGGVCLPPPKKV